MAERRGGQGPEFAAPWRDRVNTGGQPTYDRQGNLVGHDLGPEYLPPSPRTGRMVAQGTAEREYAESFGAVGSSGLWDFDEEAKSRPQARPPRPVERYDEAEMLAFVERHGQCLTAREWEVYKLFWEGHLSYGQVALRIGCKKDRVLEAVKVLRRKLRQVNALTPGPHGG